MKPRCLGRWQLDLARGLHLHCERRHQHEGACWQFSHKDPTTTAEFRALEPEDAFQSWVVDYARVRGWLVAHVRDSRRQDTDGLPDLVLARGGLVLLVELKSATGKLTAEQAAWLAAAGPHGHVWRPGQRAVASAVLS